MEKLLFMAISRLQWLAFISPSCETTTWLLASIVDYRFSWVEMRSSMRWFVAWTILSMSFGVGLEGL